MTDENPAEMEIDERAREYLRAADGAEEEELLAEWAERYYQPGYLSDSEWTFLKGRLRADDSENLMMIVRVAVYRKNATEAGRAEDFEDSWPAKEEQ